MCRHLSRKSACQSSVKFTRLRKMQPVIALWQSLYAMTLNSMKMRKPKCSNSARPLSKATKETVSISSHWPISLSVSLKCNNQACVCDFNHYLTPQTLSRHSRIRPRTTLQRNSRWVVKSRRASREVWQIRLHVKLTFTSVIGTMGGITTWSRSQRKTKKGTSPSVKSFSSIRWECWCEVSRQMS